MPRPITQPIPIEPGSLEWSKLKDRLERYSMPITECGCRVWLRSCDSSGYGTVRANFLNRTLATHRLAYTIYIGPIPEGMLVLHRCDMPPCINPNHLFLGDDAANVADRDAKGRRVDLRGVEQGRAKLSEADVLAIISDPRKHREIAADYGISTGPVMLIKSGISWTHITKGQKDLRGTPKGERVGGSKLTEPEVRQILRDPRVQWQIADSFGVCQMTISMIKQRKTWRHIQP